MFHNIPPLNNQCITKAMIDHIDFSKCLYKDTPKLVYCNPYPCKLNQYGWETYTLEGCKEMQIHWRPDAQILQIRGSLPYFLKGHNFTFGIDEFVESIDILQSLLDVGLWDASLKSFEYGAIMQVPLKPELYIKNHTALPKSKLNENYRGKDKGAGKWWDCPQVILKMYDAGKNIEMKQGLKEREVIVEEGYDPEDFYLKFEAHFLKPHLLNGGRDIFVEDLQNPDWVSVLDEILIKQYKLLKPMADLIEPTDKKNYTALDVVVGEYAKVLMNEGKPLEEAKKQIYAKINQAECLSKPDKDARKQTIRKAFSKLQEAEQSKWDLSPMLDDALTNP